jgi:hypothetical protein
MTPTKTATDWSAARIGEQAESCGMCFHWALDKIGSPNLGICIIRGMQFEQDHSCNLFDRQTVAKKDLHNG